MPDILADTLCALLLAVTAALVGRQLLPRLKRFDPKLVFVGAFIVTWVLGAIVTPVGAALYDAVLLVAGMFVTLGAFWLAGWRQRGLSANTTDTGAGPAAADRQQAALAGVFSYLWFAPVFLAVFGLRFLAY